MKNLFRSVNQSVLINSDIKVEFIGKPEGLYCFLLSSLKNSEKETKLMKIRRFHRGKNSERIRISILTTLSRKNVYVRAGRYIEQTKSVYLEIEHPKEIEVIPFEEME